MSCACNSKVNRRSNSTKQREYPR
ncbi:hypothetical protein Gorai_020270 [Gossypium raimondii]|uniref:Uncharacterized protein n=1 Tax=Gossypium raimondii TaxID=29730 RepID=A0A7J8NLV2_GOSRA|nr:hypothetical protein [Gossypium raimondii]